MRDRFPDHFVAGENASSSEAMRDDAPAFNGTKPGRSSEKLTTSRGGSTIDAPAVPATLKKGQRDNGKATKQGTRARGR